jgi:hypothetical protein
MNSLAQKFVPLALIVSFAGCRNAVHKVKSSSHWSRQLIECVSSENESFIVEMARHEELLRAEGYNLGQRTEEYIQLFTTSEPIELKIDYQSGRIKPFILITIQDCLNRTIPDSTQSDDHHLDTAVRNRLQRIVDSMIVSNNSSIEIVALLKSTPESYWDYPMFRYCVLYSHWLNYVDSPR